MKNKVLLSTLLGSALLAGCTADDALNVNKNVAEGVNPAAPVFTVSFSDDDVTRATMEESSIKWQRTDRMSLYHGGGKVYDDRGNWLAEKWGDYIGVPYETAYENSVFLKSGYVRDHDAIYSGSESGSEFTTQAMVSEGLAIMVYPADTIYKQAFSNPHISVSPVQNEETKNLTPHVSEVLEISQHGSLDDKGNEHSAGFGRKYDVQMRRIGGLMRLQLKGVEAQIEGIEFRKVKIEVGDENEEVNQIFTTESEVLIGQLRRNEGKENDPGSVYVGTNSKDHKYWKYSPWIIPVEKQNSIATSDIEDYNGYKTAFFTLLPYEDRTTKPEVIGADKSAKFGKVTVTVETNFGKVVIEDEADKKLWSDKSENNKKTIQAGLAEIMFNMFAPEPESNKLFAGQLIAVPGTRTLEVNLSELDVDGLHIQDETQLKQVAAILDKIELKKNSTFYLDGKGENKAFTIETEDGYEAYKKIVNFKQNNYGITLNLCKDVNVPEENCDLVVLKSVATDEVPEALKFGKNTTEKILVQLEGNWTLTGSHTYVNVDSLVVADHANLELKGIVNALNPDYVKGTTPETEQFVATTALVNRAEGTINVTSDVTLQMNTRNYGTMNIGLESEAGKPSLMMRMSGKNVKGISNTNVLALVNEIYADEEDYENDKAGRGNIYLWNGLSSVDGSNARVYNYGYIEIMKSSASVTGYIPQGYVLLYANGTLNPNFNAPFTNLKSGEADLNNLHSGDNIFGVVKVAGESNTNTSIQLASTAKGFVKIESNTIKSFKDNDVSLINYVKTSARTLPKTNDCPANGYIEFTGVGTVVKSGTDATALNGMIVPKDIIVSVQTGSSLSVGGIYLKGKVWKAGTFNVTNTNGYITYFGGDAGDNENVQVTGN